MLSFKWIKILFTCSKKLRVFTGHWRSMEPDVDVEMVVRILQKGVSVEALVWDDDTIAISRIDRKWTRTTFKQEPYKKTIAKTCKVCRKSSTVFKYAQKCFYSMVSQNLDCPNESGLPKWYWEKSYTIVSQSIWWSWRLWCSLVAPWKRCRRFSTLPYDGTLAIWHGGHYKQTKEIFPKIGKPR